MAQQSPEIPSVADIAALMERIAPPFLAEEWDNCGLQVGAYQWPVRSIWVALDPLPAVIQAAAKKKIDMVITHHPLLFKPLQKLDLSTSVGRIIETAVTSKTAIYAAHTNLDSTHEGINDLLAGRIGLQKQSPLQPVRKSRQGEPEPGATDLQGLGRIGRIDPPKTVGQLAHEIRTSLNLSSIRFAGDPRLKVHEAAICSGGGGSLMALFLDSEAQVYISGDLRYHDARAAEDAGRAVIDIGHFASEHIILEPLADRLLSDTQAAGWQVHIEACKLEQDPFVFIANSEE